MRRYIGRMSAAAAAALLGLTLAGCETLRGPSGGTGEPAPGVRADTSRSGGDAEALLLYFDQIKRLNASDLNKEFDAARQAYAKGNAEADRLRLALLLSLPGASFKDERKALELIEPMTKDTRAARTPTRAFADLLYAYIGEQRRLGATAQGLQDKLDALKSMERKLNERSDATGRP